MKRSIKIYFLPVLALTAVLLGSCSDWTDSESVDISRPSLEEQNPALYAQYLAALRAYKASEHKLTFVMMENRAGLAPIAQNQRLTAYPDSVDFICMTHPENLAPEYSDQMAEVRKKGTRVVCEIDYARIESEWEALQAPETDEPETDEPETPGDTESGNATDGSQDDGDGSEGDTTEPADDSAFLAFCRERVEALTASCERYGFDGVTFTYDGPVLSSLTPEQTTLFAGRLGVVYEVLKSWHAAHPEKLLFFRGGPHKLADCSLLSECSYVIVMARSATSREELTVEMYRACVEGVPTDRLIIGVTAPALDGSDELGYFSQTDAAGKPLSAIVSAASWVLEPSAYDKAGLAIDRAWNDYYDLNRIFPNIRKAIDIMNPVPEN